MNLISFFQFLVLVRIPSATFYILLCHEKFWNTSTWNSVLTQLEENVKICLKKLLKNVKWDRNIHTARFDAERPLTYKEKTFLHLLTARWAFDTGIIEVKGYLPSCPTSLLKIISNSFRLAFSVSSVSFVWLKTINWWSCNIAIECSTSFRNF